MKVLTFGSEMSKTTKEKFCAGKNVSNSVTKKKTTVNALPYCDLIYQIQECILP